jgi:hypothetical protein
MPRILGRLLITIALRPGRIIGDLTNASDSTMPIPMINAASATGS